MVSECTGIRATELSNYAATATDHERGRETQGSSSNVGSEECSDSDHGLTTSTCLLIGGHIAGVAMAVCICASSACAQSLGGYVPTFELNAWRFGVMWLCVWPFIIGRWSSIQLLVRERSKRLYLALYCLLSNVYNVTFYEASIVLPVGILGGTEFTLIILLTSIGTAALAKKCSAIITVSATLAIVGILLLVQPEFLFKYVVSTNEISTKPVCLHPRRTNVQLTNVTFDLSDNVSFYNTSDVSQYRSTHDAYTWINRSEQSYPVNTTNSSTKPFNGTTRESLESPSDILFGYLRITVAALAQASQIFIMRYWLYDSDWFVNLFWQSIMGLTISLPLMGLCEEIVFPQSTTCVALLLAHSLAASLVSVMMQVSTSTIPALTHSLLASLSLVFMIVAQYTALSHINPGHQNVLEVTGAALVLVASLSEPTYRFYSQKAKSARTDQQSCT